MDIEWFPFNGYEGFYEWNPTLKEMRSLPRNTTNGKVLPWNYGSNGRPFVMLSKNGVTRHYSLAMCIYSFVHQVEIPLGYQVHHIDYNNQNNDPSNLQMLTREEHMEKHEQFQKNNYRSKAVVAVDERGNVVYRFASTREAGRNGFDHENVSKACRGCYSTHKGHFYKGYYWFFE